MQHCELNEQIDTWRAYLQNVKAQAMGNVAKEGGKQSGCKHRFFKGMRSHKKDDKKNKVSHCA